MFQFEWTWATKKRVSTPVGAFFLVHGAVSVLRLGSKADSSRMFGHQSHAQMLASSMAVDVRRPAPATDNLSS